MSSDRILICKIGQLGGHGGVGWLGEQMGLGGRTGKVNRLRLSSLSLSLSLSQFRTRTAQLNTCHRQRRPSTEDTPAQGVSYGLLALCLRPQQLAQPPPSWRMRAALRTTELWASFSSSQSRDAPVCWKGHGTIATPWSANHALTRVFRMHAQMLLPHRITKGPSKAAHPTLSMADVVFCQP